MKHKTHRTHTTSLLAAQLEDGALADSKALAFFMRGWLEEKRREIAEFFIRHGDPYLYLKEHTGIIDEIIEALCNHYNTQHARLAIIATGGYGRKELFPYSDIDLLFLHEEDIPAVAGLTKDILYVLWDLGFSIGHAYRSTEEALKLSTENIGLRTNLLDARLVVGSEAIFKEFSQRFNEEIVFKTPLDFVEAKLAERDSRHKRYGDSRYMLEPNIKEGKGGLRDLHTIWWLTRYAYPISSLQDLMAQGLITKEEYNMLDEATQFLYSVRIHLHLLAGHAEERLGFDQQHALAPLMGFRHEASNKSVERFMRRYFVAVRTVGSMTRIFCAMLEEEKKRKPKRPFADLLPATQPAGDFVVDGERLAVREETIFEDNPVSMIGLFHEAQQRGLDIHPKSLHLVTRNLHRIDAKLQKDPAAGALFMEILLSPKLAETTLRRMSEAGVLGRFIPDFGRAVGRTQFNRYHVYTVDEHTLVAVGNLHALENGLLKDQLPLASDAMPRIKMRRVLYLAVFCHDIAKGRGGDHSDLGAAIVERLAKRFGFSQDEIETAGWLVRQHLLFSDTAFKRDLGDPKTLEDFVAQVRSPERLRLLLALTVVDIRAVGPEVWNEWKASLLRDLFSLAQHAMGAGTYAGGKAREETLQAALFASGSGWSADEAARYTGLLSAGFISYCSEAQHLIIAEMVRRHRAQQKALQVEIKHDTKHHVTEIIVCAEDQKGLFSKLSGAMALAGANIIGAKIFTLHDGMAVDIFQIQNAAGEIFNQKDKLSRMKLYMEQAVTNTMDLGQAFAEHRKEFSFRKKMAGSFGQVFFENDASNFCTVLEITAQDRMGILYAITSTLAAFDISIVTAHISTYGTQVSDVFYIKDNFGMKITHAGRLSHIREALMHVINPQN